MHVWLEKVIYGKRLFVIDIFYVSTRNIEDTIRRMCYK